MGSRGVIVGSDAQGEWLLAWWWRHYARHNDLPVIFCDFGMSEQAVSWCRERGEVVSLDRDQHAVAQKEDVDPDLRSSWEHLYGSSIWNVRKAWFYKPKACLKSPFELSVWLDLDCEVCGSLNPIFEALGPVAQIGICPSASGPASLSSGVIVFRRQSELIVRWAECCLTLHSSQVGDDNVLSALLNDPSTPAEAFEILPSKYNWMGGPGLNLLLDLDSPKMKEALIIHWISLSKIFIETHGGYQDYMNANSKR